MQRSIRTTWIQPISAQLKKQTNHPKEEFTMQTAKASCKKKAMKIFEELEEK
jgi:hypothetical protein